MTVRARNDEAFRSRHEITKSNVSIISPISSNHAVDG
jgi:hypothetical protein